MKKMILSLVRTHLLMSFFVFSFILSSAAQAQMKAHYLQEVPTKRVCMVTNMVFPRDQIEVKVGSKTYYGCCENCKKTLNEDAASRTAKDVVSGKIVDKASAVIGATAQGDVMYFESRANLERYNSRP